MLQRLFSRKPGPASTDGRLVYAVGDIHGCVFLFDRLVNAIRADAATATAAGRPILVLLGDYIDRGPASDLVIERCLSLSKGEEFEVRTLKGNHEDAMLQFMERPHAGPDWVRYGGGETLAAYGLSAPGPDDDIETWLALGKALKATLPPPHLSFLRRLELMAIIGDYAFVHAGVKPKRALAKQEEKDLLWIRREFLDANRRHEKIIVHGHTPAKEVEILPHRIGVDTGAYATGTLSAVRILDADRTIIQVHGKPQ